MKIHELKVRPKFFQDMVDENKQFEVRKNDRDFKEGDMLHLREWSPTQIQLPGDAHADFFFGAKGYTGREMMGIITYIMDLGVPFVVAPGYVAMAVDIIYLSDGC